jgi:hypothetical protein
LGTGDFFDGAAFFIIGCQMVDMTPTFLLSRPEGQERETQLFS